MYIANIFLNMFASLVYVIMAFIFVGYMAESTSVWVEVGLLTDKSTILGLHKLQWIVIFFLNVYFIGVYAYIWGRSIGFKFLFVLAWLVAGVAVLFFLWPGKGADGGSLLEWGHLGLMGGFVTGAILLSASTFLKALNEQQKKKAMESGNLAGG